MTTSDRHVPPGMLDRYARGEPALLDRQVWVVEAHLERCPVCRAQLAEAVSAQPSLDSLLTEVWARVESASAGHQPARQRAWRGWLWSWVTPAPIPWLVTTVLVTVMAVVVDLYITVSTLSVVLLLAPVLPVVGVAMSWAKGADPAHEIVASTAQAGLYLLLRRTLAVLVVVVPLLGIAGWLVAASPVLWLLPALAFTIGTLALGGVIGISRAAYGLAAAWMVAVVVPSLATWTVPAAVRPASVPFWAVSIVVGVLVLWLRPEGYRWLRSHQ